MSEYAINGTLLVGTLCELANRGVDNIGEGCLAYVVATGQYFRMSMDTAPLTPNGSTVLTTVGGPAMAPCVQNYSSTGIGRWILTNIGDVVNPFASVAAWYIDPVAGIDTDTGTSALHPLKTFHALAARWEGITQPTTATVRVHIIGVGTSLAAGDQIIINRPVNPLFPIIVEASFARVTVTTGTITTLTALNRATNTSVQIDGTLAAGAWAAYVGKIIRITSGVAPFAWAVITEALGGTNVRTTPFITQASDSNPSFVQVSPANGSTYEIVEPIKITDNVTSNLPRVNVGPEGVVYFYDVNFYDNGLASASESVGVESAGTVYVYRSVSDSVSHYTAYSCKSFVFGGSFANFDQLDINNGDLYSLNSLFRVVGSAPNGTLTLGTDSGFPVGTDLTYSASKYLIDNVNITKALSPALDLPAFSKALFSGAVYGTGIAATHIALHNFTHAEYTGGATFPAVVAALQHPLDFQNGVVKDYADLPFGSTATFSDSQAYLLLQK